MANPAIWKCRLQLFHSFVGDSLLARGFDLLKQYLDTRNQQPEVTADEEIPLTEITEIEHRLTEPGSR